MKWRCEYCGKPHERNDPPCDNCGNNEFEKAVVPMAPEAEDEEQAKTYVWVCTECGNDHPKNTPPCDRCGAAPLERREQTYDEDDILAEMLDDGRSAPSAEVSYLDVLDAKLVAMFLGVGALVAILALGFLGVVDVPGITPVGPPPGEATDAGGLSLAETESAYLEQLNDRRAASGVGELTESESLASAATYYNQERVRLDYGGGEGPDPGELRSDLAAACGETQPRLVEYRLASTLGTEGATEYASADELAVALLDSPGAPDSDASATEGLVGVDVHVAPDGTVYVTQFVC